MLKRWAKVDKLIITRHGPGDIMEFYENNVELFMHLSL
ncbi:hypothetical protein BH09BAC4_BH09BAC4_09550 [soil metagenome]